MRREIEAEGGTVEKFIGDAVMSVFGVPTSHDDDATRAFRAALRMRAALAELNEELRASFGLSLEMRIGISMGEVLAVTAPRPGEGMIKGDAANVAARLEQAAMPGHILVSDRAAQATNGFELVDRGPLEVRGRTQPVHVFELIGGHGDGARPQGPVVGRERELALLQTVYDRAVSEGRPHLVTIFGDPGVGKSRLVEEFVDRALAEPNAPTVLRGRCLSYGEGITYWALREILQQQADVLASDPADQAYEKVHRACEALLGDLGVDLERTIATLCLTVGIRLPNPGGQVAESARGRHEIAAAWQQFFAGLARQRPTIVVLEDLHWADAPLLDVLQEVLPRIDGPLVMLATARPELARRRPDWGWGGANTSTLMLEPLSAEESQTLLRLLDPAHRMDDDLRDRILERAGGNPFFLEEIVARLADEELGGEAGGELQIPDTVQALLSARMDLLSASEKRTLQLAAVVGRTFWTGSVASLDGGDPEPVDEVLRRLETRGLVLSRLGSSMAGEREWTFKHILTRDAAYESLPRRERARAHERLAAWIEGSASGRTSELGELLAYHYGEAYRETRDHGSSEDLARLRHQAFDWALTAAEESRRRVALAKSLQLAGEALDLAEGERQRALALEALAEAEFLDFQGDRAWRRYREAIEAVRRLDPPDPRFLARLAVRALELPARGAGAMRTRPSQEDVNVLLELAQSALGTDAGEDLARLLIVRAFLSYPAGANRLSEARLREAKDLGEQAAALAERLDRPGLTSAALDAVWNAYMLQGLYGLAESVVLRRLELVDRLEDPAEVGDILSVAAWTEFEIGRYARCRELADQGFRRAGAEAPATALHSLDWRAVANCRLGDWDAFLADIALAEDLLGDRKERPPAFSSDHVAAAAFVLDVRGEAERAARYLERLEWLERSDESRSPWWSVWHAELLARRDRPDEAFALLDELAERGGGGAMLEGRCDVVAEAGRWELAEPTVADARDQAERAGLIALRFYADRLEGRRHLAAGSADRAVRPLEEAATGFASLGAAWEAAASTLWLAEARAGVGEATGARRAAEDALAVMDRLRSGREVAQARRILAALDGAS
jgi:hypothetical protein